MARPTPAYSAPPAGPSRPAAAGLAALLILGSTTLAAAPAEAAPRGGLADRVDGLLADHGEAPLDGDARAALQDLSEPLRANLTDLLVAYRAYADAAEETPVEAVRDGAPPGPLKAARARVLAAGTGLQGAARRVGPQPVEVRRPPVLVLDLDADDDRHDADALLHVDLAGDDTYRNNAGGSAILPPPGSPAAAAGDPCQEPSYDVETDAAPDDDGVGAGLTADAGLQAAAALVDVAGDDDYVPDRDCGVVGGGYRGAGLLLDAAGDDTYEPDRSGNATPPLPGRRRPPALDAAGEVEASTGADELVVGLREGTALPNGSAFLGAPVADRDATLGFLVVRPEDAPAYASRARDHPDVAYVEPDAAVRVLGGTADPFPDDPHWEDQYGPQRVDAPEAWTVENGSVSTRLCVADTGLDPTHEDIPAHRYLGGRDLHEDDPFPQDEHGHGTHVAGIAAAATDNGEGIAGMAQVGILAARVLGPEGFGDASDVAQGIRWCADQGADVISMSLGGARTRVEAEAVRYAWAHGTVLVAAAGNAGQWGTVAYPAAFPEVAAVGCTTPAGDLCSFSSTGPQIELVAPGKDVLSLCAGDLCTDARPDCTSDRRYCRLSGTSQSAPHVAGVAALLRSAAPDLANGRVRQVLRETAQDRGTPGCDTRTGYGLVDADAALARLDDPPAYTGGGPCRTGNVGTNGGAFLGAGALVDLAGDDTYRAGAAGTNGGAKSGSGLLVDAGGEDAYRAGTIATNGGAHRRGAGHLLDLGSSPDAYRAASAGTNGGAWAPPSDGIESLGLVGDTYGAATGTHPSGLLWDAGGDDTYRAGGNGTNGGVVNAAPARCDGDRPGDPACRAAGAAQGLLLDTLGRDTYEAARGSGTDVSMAPKGYAGAQVDGPCPEPPACPRGGDAPRPRSLVQEVLPDEVLLRVGVTVEAA